MENNCLRETNTISVSHGDLCMGMWLRLVAMTRFCSISLGVHFLMLDRDNNDLTIVYLGFFFGLEKKWKFGLIFVPCQVKGQKHFKQMETQMHIMCTQRHPRQQTHFSLFTIPNLGDFFLQFVWLTRGQMYGKWLYKKCVPDKSFCSSCTRKTFALSDETFLEYCFGFLLFTMCYIP